uniref:LON peptidase N-terminal domain and ring finger 3 n=1 Tax=Cyclopterus lumpus TaxID=8103 RepID=A0A8C3ABG7_CYCLU
MGTESESMLQLAADAFQSNNFDLAADIYECQLACLGDPGGRQELMVMRADALAFGGKFTEAFDAYRQASETERLRPIHLTNLIEYLSSSIGEQGAGGDGRHETPRKGGQVGAAAAGRPTGGGAAGFGYEDFSCRICLSFLFEPVTLPCGHCFCKKCLERERKEKELPVMCKECGDGSRVAGVQSYRVDVVLSNLLAKWFPTLHQAGRLRREGNALYAERKVEAALDKYNRATLIAPMDHILFSNRSQIHSSLRHYEKALRDAEMACRLMPHWSKGHVRKAQALVSLGRTEEALREYLVCLSIEPDCRLANVEAHRVNHHEKHRSSEEEEDEGQERRDDHKRVKSGEFTRKPPARSLAACVLFKMQPERNQHKGFLSLPADNLKLIFISHCFDKLSTVLRCCVCLLVPPPRLFYEPVTTPCGHTFCLRCLERCLDHNPKCPLCKEELSEYLVQRPYCKTVLTENLISKYLPSELIERQKIHQEEMAELSNLNKNVPIFVCTMAFPTVPCPLHIFEPCYRLMIRRCIETGTNSFGMCLGDNLKGFADYGCLLEIGDVKFFSDGRSVVNTVGMRRFKVVQHSERDGYNMADIEYLEDVKVEGLAERELHTLHDAVYDQALVWVNSLKAEQKDRIEGHFGPMPQKDSELQQSPNGPSWCWWLLAVLPLEGRAQLPFLALTSLKDRLSGIRKVLLFMAHSRHRGH